MQDLIMCEVMYLIKQVGRVKGVAFTHLSVDKSLLGFVFDL